MARYTVVWQNEVRDALAAIWINSGDRTAVSTAADLIDRELARDPEQKGHPVGDRLRVLREPPLEVLSRRPVQIGSLKSWLSGGPIRMIE
jgi:hypothetical protein